MQVHEDWKEGHRGDLPGDADARELVKVEIKAVGRAALVAKVGAEGLHVAREEWQRAHHDVHAVVHAEAHLRREEEVHREADGATRKHGNAQGRTGRRLALGGHARPDRDGRDEHDDHVQREQRSKVFDEELLLVLRFGES